MPVVSNLELFCLIMLLTEAGLGVLTELKTGVGRTTDNFGSNTKFHTVMKVLNCSFIN